MYCIKCGVELSDSKRACPLCGTVPYHPELQETGELPPYPPFVKPEKKVKRSLIMLLFTLLYGLCAAQLMLLDAVISGGLSWSFFAVGGMALFYVAVGLPLWFKKPNPVIFTPCFFAAAELYLLSIDLLTGGGWFLSFAFPVAGIAGLIATAVVTLIKYVKGGHFFTVGGAVIAAGAYAILVEMFAVFTFDPIVFHMWSLYPASGCFILGMALIVLGICKPLRAWFAKKFFI